MPEAISNTSPLIYLHRIDALDWLSRLFTSVWIPPQVVNELDAGRQRGYDVPDPLSMDLVSVVSPSHMPSEWFALDLGIGEVAAMSLGLEHPQRIVILDDLPARRTAQAAGLNVWGTLRILLEAKQNGLTHEITEHVKGLKSSGMYISDALMRRILQLADE